MKLVGKSFNGERTASRNGLSGNNDFCASMESTCHNLRTEVFVMDQKANMDNINPTEIKLERRKTPEASVTEREKTRCEVTGERCNGRAHRRTQGEHAPCQCYNHRFQWQQLARS